MKLHPIWLATGLLAVFNPAILKTEACNNSEVCDGVDNNGDGQIDEGFDTDADGHLDADACASGDDCDDTNSAVFSGASEVPDGLDNDCDGQIDELTQKYTLTFIATGDGAPLAGVVVWVGEEGNGSWTTSDENGRASLYFDAAPTSWSYASTSWSGSSREYRRITSYQNSPMPTESNIRVTAYEHPAPAYLVSGSVSGISTSQTGTGVYALWSDAMVEMPADATFKQFSLDATSSRFLQAGQTTYQDPDGTPYLDSFTMDQTFGLVLDPVTGSSVLLKYRFDLPVTFQTTTPDPRVTQVFPDYNLYRGTEYLQWFYDATLPLSSTGKYTGHAVTSTGVIAQLSAVVGINLTDPNQVIGQYGELLLAPGTTHNISLPPVPDLQPYAPISEANLPGQTLPLTTTQKSSAVQVRYYGYQTANAEGFQARNIWSLRQEDPTQPVRFPKVPPAAFVWPSPYSTGTYSLQWAPLTAIYNAGEDSPNLAYGSRDLDVSSGMIFRQQARHADTRFARENPEVVRALRPGSAGLE